MEFCLFTGDSEGLSNKSMLFMLARCRWSLEVAPGFGKVPPAVETAAATAAADMGAELSKARFVIDLERSEKCVFGGREKEEEREPIGSWNVGKLPMPRPWGPIGEAVCVEEERSMSCGIGVSMSWPS